MRVGDLKHYVFRNTCFPYDSNGTPLDGPGWESGSKNCLTSIRQYCERAPGFAAYEAAATTFTGIVERIFTWEKWDGTFYILACETYTGYSKVWKLQVGTDAAFVLLYDDITTTDPWDFCISNNTLYFMNGAEAWAWNGGAAAVRPWGIGTAEMIRGAGEYAKGRPTVTLGGVGISATVGYRYVYTWYNSVTGHQSSASNPSATTGVFTNNTVTITLNQTPDTQVDQVRVYRTTDGGGGVYFEITGSPFAHTPGVGTMAVTDTTLDADLSSFKAPVGPDLGTSATPTPHGQHDPPTVGYGPVWYANRIWWFKDNVVYYTGWEEIVDIGLEEECVPPDNQLVFSQSIKALATNDDYLLVFTSSNVWKISGDSLASFARMPLFRNLGTRNRACVATYGKSIAWFDVSHTVRITDAFQQKELSVDIRPDLATVDPETASLSFYSQGAYHWLCLLDGTGGRMWVYDLDSEQWMPPWDYVGAGRALWWGEVAAGTPALLLGAASKRVLRLTPTAYLFDGSAYTAELRSYLMELVPPEQPARIANAQIITVERNAVELLDVAECRDDNTDTATYTSDLTNNANILDGALTISPPLRPVGTDIVEEWFGTQQIACKRMSVKFKWAATNSNFILYSFGVGFYELT